jgi:hypothetical protein
MKKLILVLAIVLLTVNFVSAEDYKVQGDFDNTTNPSEISSESYRLNGGITANPVVETGKKFELGRSFNEAGITVGGYWNDQDLRGGYLMLEANRWQEQKGASRNWSFLGGVLAYEPGEVNNFEWKKVKVLYQPGLYQPLDNHETWHLLLKPRIGFYIDSGTSDESGLAYGGIAEVIKTFNPFDKIGLTVDSMFESRERGEDGYIAVRPFYEKLWSNGNSMKFSAGPIFHYTPDDTFTSFCPGVSLRIPVSADYALNFGASVDFGEETQTYGVFVSLSWNDIRYNFK